MARRQPTDERRPGSDDAAEPAARFLAAVATCAKDPRGAELFAVVEVSGLSWGAATSMAGRLRRRGWLASLPHRRLILSERGRAAAGPT